MRLHMFAAGAALVLAVPAASAGLRPQLRPEAIPLHIGSIARISDPAPATWGIAGMDILTVRSSVNGVTPVMRTEEMDARLVEILSRTQNPPLRPRDVAVTSVGNRTYITVRGYELAEVHREDAAAAGMTRQALAREWARAIQAVLPHITPLPNRRGA